MVGRSAHQNQISMHAEHLGHGDLLLCFRCSGDWLDNADPGRKTSSAHGCVAGPLDKRQLAIVRVQDSALQQIAEIEIVIVNQGAQHPQQLFFHADPVCPRSTAYFRCEAVMVVPRHQSTRFPRNCRFRLRTAFEGLPTCPSKIVSEYARPQARLNADV